MQDGRDAERGIRNIMTMNHQAWEVKRGQCVYSVYTVCMIKFPGLRIVKSGSSLRRSSVCAGNIRDTPESKPQLELTASEICDNM